MKTSSDFAYIWEYVVKEDQVDTFRRIYGPDGDWVELFCRDREYLRTVLYQNVDDPGRFVTTDFWTSQTARDAFRKKFKKEFDALDKRCESLTEQERPLGDFQAVTN